MYKVEGLDNKLEDSSTSMSEDTRVELRQYIERILEEREKLFDAKISNMLARMEKLNELRSEVTTDRNQFLRTGVYDEMHKALMNRVEKLEAMHGRFIGVGIVLVALMGILGAVVAHLLKL